MEMYCKNLKMIISSLVIFVVGGFFLVLPGQSSDLSLESPSLDYASSEAPPPQKLRASFERNHKVTADREWIPNKKNPYWNKKFFTHTFSSGSHSVSVYGKNVYVVWYDTRRGSADVYFSQSSDSGSSFGQSIRVNDDEMGTIHYKPGMGVDSEGRIYVAWRDDRNGHADIYFSMSVDGGKSFSKNKKLNDDRGWSYQGNPSLAVSPNGLVGVAWNEKRNKNDDIYFTISADGGSTFSKNMKANDDQGEAAQSHPTIAIGSNGLVVIAWQDFRNGDSDIYMTKSTDGGKIFSPNQKLNDDPVSSPQVSPSAAVSGKNVLIVWADYRNGIMDLSPPDSANAEPLWWEQVRKGNPDIYYIVSRDGAEHFSPNSKANDDTGVSAQAFPSAALDGTGRLFIAWEDYRHENGDIYFAQSLSAGLRLGPNIKVNDDTGQAGQYHPSLTSDALGQTYVIWTDVRDIQRFRSTGEGDFEEGIDYKKEKVFRKTLEDVYFAIGKSDGIRISNKHMP